MLDLSMKYPQTQAYVHSMVERFMAGDLDGSFVTTIANKMEGRICNMPVRKCDGEYVRLDIFDHFEGSGFAKPYPARIEISFNDEIYYVVWEAE